MRKMLAVIDGIRELTPLICGLGIPFAIAVAAARTDSLYTANSLAFVGWLIVGALVVTIMQGGKDD